MPGSRRVSLFCHDVSESHQKHAMTHPPILTHWKNDLPPTRPAIWQLMVEEGLNPYSWSNSAFDLYAAHTHARHKVLYVVQGSITFGLPEEGKFFTLQAGDRLDLPAGTLHNAQVGANGVTCLESYR